MEIYLVPLFPQMPTISPPKKLSPGRHQFSVTFSEEESRNAEQNALKKLSGNVRVPGFRPGHAPADIVRANVKPEALLDQLMRELLPQTFATIVHDNKLEPIIPPRVELTSQSPLSANVVIVERPPVTLKSVKKIEKKEPKADAKEVEKMLDYLRNQNRHTHPVERAAKEGDQVTMDFVGTDKEGKEVPGTRSQGYQVAIGSKSLIPGFEEALTGMQKGEQKSFTLTFPEKYHAEHLRNQPVTFVVTLGTVEEVHLPELTDAYVKERGLAESLDKLKETIETSMQRQEEDIEKRRRENAVLDAIREATRVDLPQELIEQEERQLSEEIGRQLAEQKMSFEDWLKQTGRTAEDIQKDLKQEAIKRITLRFGIEKVMEEKQIDVSEEEMKGLISEQLQQIPESDRIEAASHFQTGHEEYEQLKWQKKIEKMMAILL